MQMDQVTQQNAALVEEAAAAAESLQDQARNLVQVVSVFKLDGSYALQRATSTVLNDTNKPAFASSATKKLANKPVTSNDRSVALAGVGAEWEQF